VEGDAALSMRVAFRLNRANVWMGGVNYLLNICRVLRTHAPDIEPVIFAPASIGAGLRDRIAASNGAPPIDLEQRSRWDDNLAILGFPRTREAEVFERHGVDLVFESEGYYGAQPPFPVLAWLPDFQHRRLPHLFPRLQWLAREARFRRILATRRHVLLSSQDARADAEALYAPIRAALHVVPFAVRLEQHADYAAGEAARLRLGLPERFVFLPNQVWVHKNHALVVEALGLLGDAAPVVAATGSANDPRAPGLSVRLRHRAAELGVGDRFRMLGELPYADILALNARADCLLNPSLFEGWSTTVEEAKALATPLLLSDLGVHREQAGGRATYFDATDAGACATALRRIAERAPRTGSSGSRDAENEAAQRRFAALLREAFVSAVG
jgi:glycosyltransferase involved in cell wall biosynthesis